MTKIISENIKAYFINCIEQGKMEVDVVDANADIQRIIDEVEETGGWIPCSKELPPLWTPVIITRENMGNTSKPRYISRAMIGNTHDKKGRPINDELEWKAFDGDKTHPKGCLENDSVVAWMPQPAIYEGEWDKKPFWQEPGWVKPEVPNIYD